MNAIIENAVAAQKKWREVPVQQRVRVLIKFHTLLVANKDAIADIIVRSERSLCLLIPCSQLMTASFL